MKVLQKINLGIDKYVVYDFMEMDLISLIKVKVLESVTVSYYLRDISKLFCVICLLHYILSIQVD